MLLPGGNYFRGPKNNMILKKNLFICVTWYESQRYRDVSGINIYNIIKKTSLDTFWGLSTFEGGSPFLGFIKRQKLLTLLPGGRNFWGLPVMGTLR